MIYLNSTQNKVSFGCALTKQEEKEFTKTEIQAEKALGIDKGMTVYKVFSQSLPEYENKSTGIGKLNSQRGLDYLKFMKLYTGANIVKEYPIGEMTRLQNNYFCPYNRMATVIGEDNINLNKLATDDYGCLLNKKDIKPYLCGNKEGFGFDNAVQFENELGTSSDFPILKPLKTAYNNMETQDTPAINNIKEEFCKFKNSIDNDLYDRLALYPIISKDEPDLFKGIDNSEQKQEKYQKYISEHKEEIDFYKFRKFIATKQHNEARANLKANGLELFGDCPTGFSPQEVWAFPDAFYPKHISPGWNFRAINFEEAIKEGTPANHLFKEKIKFHLENYDGIRFDVGWQYITPNLKDSLNPKDIKPYKCKVEDKIVKFIEKTAIEIKGKDYDTKKLMYESDAGPDDYQLFDFTTGTPIAKSKLKGRTSVLSTQYENADGNGWGNPQFFDKFGLSDYIIGTNNHDGAPLRVLAENKYDKNGDDKIPLEEIRENNKKALKKSLKLTNNEAKKLDNPNNFVKAKFAELYTAKNRFLFFNDVMGNNKRLDEESGDIKNYRIKITNNYEKEYHTALQKNQGFNLMESLRIAMKSKNIDKTNPNLYKKVNAYAKYLAKEGAKTNKEAEKEYQLTGGFDKFAKEYII